MTDPFIHISWELEFLSFDLSTEKLTIIRDRQIFLQIENFLPPDDSETSEPEQSTGKKTENSNFLLLEKKSTFIFLVNIIRI